MFNAALFTIARTRKQPRCPLTDEWIKNLWYIYTMEYYSATKRNTFETVLMRWTNLEPIISSEMRQRNINITYWCWEGLGAGGEGDDRGWGGWIESSTRCTWVWVNSGSWSWTGALRFMGSKRVGHDWATELNWSECIYMESRKMALIIFRAAMEKQT